MKAFLRNFPPLNKLKPMQFFIVINICTKLCYLCVCTHRGEYYCALYVQYVHTSTSHRTVSALSAIIE